MINALFVGSYLSKISGTKDIAEKISSLLKEDYINLTLVSCKKNKLLRFIDILLNVLLAKSRVVNYDVFSGQAFMITEFGSFFSKLKKQRIIYTLRGGALADFDNEYPERIRRVFDRADYLQTPSLFLQSYFREKGYLVNYLPNPLNLDQFPYQLGSTTTRKLLWVRAFASVYNPDLAIKALAKIRERFPEVTLTMVGPDKGLLEKTKQLIHELQLSDAVDIVGPIQNDSLFRFFHSHSVYLNTTSYESFGTAVLEAAACGVPVVSTNVGEIPYLWTHNENILLSDDFEAASFAEQVFRLFEDDKLVEQLSINARRKAETFGWEKIKPLWVELLS